MDVICNLSDELHTGLDLKSMEALVDLLALGVHPEALAAVVFELRKEAKKKS